MHIIEEKEYGNKPIKKWIMMQHKRIIMIQGSFSKDGKILNRRHDPQRIVSRETILSLDCIELFFYVPLSKDRMLLTGKNNP